jgi:hypothetical protein
VLLKREARGADCAFYFWLAFAGCSRPPLPPPKIGLFSVAEITSRLVSGAPPVQSRFEINFPAIQSMKLLKLAVPPLEKPAQAQLAGLLLADK